MGTDSGWQPATPAERYRSIDIIRGLALFGVLIVNLLTAFKAPLLERILGAGADPGRADRAVDLLVNGVLEFKAITIFSFLFGVGIAIQTERASARDVSARNFLVRRLAWLLVLGAAHLFLIWNGDILTLYAVCGLLLLPCLRLSWPALFVMGAAAIAIPEVAWFWLPLPSGDAATAQIAQARRVYGSAGYLAILGFRWHESWSVVAPLLIGILPRTTGLMYWGMAAWRSGILREPERYRGRLIVALALGGLLGAAVTVNELWAKSSGSAPWPALLAAGTTGPLLLALAYVSGLLLWSKTGSGSSLPGLAATGRMALTNYLVQSIVLGFVFYGYGFGLFGRIGSATAALIGVALYITQLQLSRWWLRHYRFGPFEWLWRSLAYWRRQPVRYQRRGFAAG